MVQSNEFTAPTLSGAVKKATTAYRSRQGLEHKGICSDLVLELADFKRAAADVLQHSVDRLGDNILRIAAQYRRSGCAASDRIS